MPAPSTSATNCSAASTDHPTNNWEASQMAKRRRIASRAMATFVRLQSTTFPRFFIRREDESLVLREDGSKFKRET